ncbi:MAG: DUF1572 family protein [Gemmatimonadaceae bacterium]
MSSAKPASMETVYLTDVKARFDSIKTQAERAAAQVDDAAFFAPLGAEENSIAIVMKHMSGNLRSRFSDFLTSDGEKPDRNRDGEFEQGAGDSRAAILARWAEGWRILSDTLDALTPSDLTRTVTIRGEPHTVIQALSRQLVHQSQHAGQVVLLAKHAAGARWRTLSIPRGQSTAFTPDLKR